MVADETNLVTWRCDVDYTITEEQVKNVTSREQHSSWYAYSLVFRCLAIFFGVFVLTATFYTRSVAWTLITPLLLGVAGYRIQFILHDTSHYSLFKAKRSNTFIGTVAGWLVGVNYRRYRFTHMWHHRRNGEPEDPQYADYLGDGGMSRQEFLRFLISPVIGGRLLPYLSREMGEREVSGHSAPKSGIKWWIGFVVVQASLFILSYQIANHPEFLFFYYVGLATMSLFLARIRTIAEHQQIPSVSNDFSRSHKWNLIDWIFFYDSNFNYHVEHHLYPNLQSKYLKNVSRMLQQSGKMSPEGTSSSVSKTLRSLYRSLPK